MPVSAASKGEIWRVAYPCDLCERRHPQRIEGAKEESFHICEVCGQLGTLREGQWIKTLCDDRAGARGAREIGW